METRDRSAKSIQGAPPSTSGQLVISSTPIASTPVTSAPVAAVPRRRWSPVQVQQRRNTATTLPLIDAHSSNTHSWNVLKWEIIYGNDNVTRLYIDQLAREGRDIFGTDPFGRAFLERHQEESISVSEHSEVRSGRLCIPQSPRI